MGGADGIKAILNDGAGEFGFVAVAAEMAEVNVLKICGDKLSEDGCSRFIAEMPVTTHDSLFDAPRTAKIVLQQLHVVVCFENEDVGRANPFHDELGGVTEISEETDATTVRAQHK